MIGRSVTVAAVLVLMASSAWAGSATGSMCPRQTQAMAATETAPSETTIATEPTGDEAVIATETTSTETSN